MGKRKIDKCKKIENKSQRKATFCKRKRGFIKKAIELSKLCDQEILIVMYDKEQDKVIQFSSNQSFQFQKAFEIVKRLKNSYNSNINYEFYTNDDYQKFEHVDFRKLRYQQKGGNSKSDRSSLDFDDYSQNEEFQKTVKIEKDIQNIVSTNHFISENLEPLQWQPNVSHDKINFEDLQPILKMQKIDQKAINIVASQSTHNRSIQQKSFLLPEQLENIKDSPDHFNFDLKSNQMRKCTSSFRTVRSQKDKVDQYFDSFSFSKDKDIFQDKANEEISNEYQKQKQMELEQLEFQSKTSSLFT